MQVPRTEEGLEGRSWAEELTESEALFEDDSEWTDVHVADLEQALAHIVDRRGGQNTGVGDFGQTRRNDTFSLKDDEASEAGFSDDVWTHVGLPDPEEVAPASSPSRTNDPQSAQRQTVEDAPETAALIQTCPISAVQHQARVIPMLWVGHAPEVLRHARAFMSSLTRDPSADKLELQVLDDEDQLEAEAAERRTEAEEAARRAEAEEATRRRAED